MTTLDRIHNHGCTNARLIAVLLERAAPVVSHYWADLRHDATRLANEGEGAVYFWAPREMGTFLFCLRKKKQYNIHAAPCWRAMNQRGLHWHKIQFFGNNYCEISSIDADDIDATIEATDRMVTNRVVPTFEQLDM